MVSVGKSTLAVHGVEILGRFIIPYCGLLVNDLQSYYFNLMKSKGGASMGEKIRQARENAGLSQKQLAEALGLDQSAVSNWETGKNEPTLHNLRRMADILGVDPGSLL